MKSLPIVTVIIIFYNTEKFLAEAIESVFAQSFADWELLLVDDGSSDGSTEIAQRYVQAHPDRVFYLEHEGHRNRGMSATRNLGLAHARGEYIALLDADDVWVPHKLEQQVALLRAHPEAALVAGTARYWFSWTGAPGDAEKDFIEALGTPIDTLSAPPLRLRLSLESRVPTPGLCALLIKRAALEAVGGFEAERFAGIYQLYEDQACLAKLTVRYPIYVSSEIWFLYRQHGDSCVATAERDGRERQVGLYYLAWLAEYLQAQGVTDKALWRALAQKRRRYSHPQLAALRSKVVEQCGYWGEGFKSVARRLLPASAYAWLKRHWRARNATAIPEMEPEQRSD